MTATTAQGQDLSAPGAEHARTASARLPLVGTLLLRATVNAVFAGWVLMGDPSWLEIFSVGSVFAFIDGGIGLLTGWLIGRNQPVRAPTILVSLVLVDAVLRLSAGAAIRVFPGIADIPLTVVLFFATLGAWAAIAGVSATVASIVAHTHHHEGESSLRVYAVFDPLSAAGLVAFALAGYALVIGPPATVEELRTAVAAASSAMAIVYVAASAFGRRK